MVEEDDVPLQAKATAWKVNGETSVRNRRNIEQVSPSQIDINEASVQNVETIWGKTPSGTVFRVPVTHSFLHTMLSTLQRSSLTRLTFLSLIIQPFIFYALRDHSTTRSIFFLLYFAFWRGCYDFGFAWILRQQSEKQWVVRALKRQGWLNGDKAERWKKELKLKMGEEYDWDQMPAEFNSWLIFRQLVDVVLLNDFVSYSCFAWANLHFPSNHSIFMHIFRWMFGWALILFNLWVKIDAHRVVKDYAWYWGDAFWLMVTQNDLVFDGVYEIAPHPMYSVGYAGYYGLSMVVGSYSVLFVSLAAHAAQFAFLLWFENPHIERTYGAGKKPLASRVPLARAPSVEDATPAVTEGETDTESELPELSDDKYDARPTRPVAPSHNRRKSVSMHDLTHRYFRKPVIVLSRIDVFRAPDFAIVTLLLYALSTLVPPLPSRVALSAHFLHALSWRVFHSFGLGLLLRAQSKSKWLVRHYLKHYHYPGDSVEEDDVATRATEEAFGNWQVMYNMSLVMTYVSFAGLAWKTYHLPMDWTVSGTILRHVLGLALVSLHIWSAISSYEVLGDFGWLYSDFFLTGQIPSQLGYTGIYRFLNNPEQSMGGAAFFGLWLISNSKLVLTLAIISHLSHWWFLSTVERPHMQRLYGGRLRKDGGLSKTLKSVANRTLDTKHASEFKRVVQEVYESIEKVEERVTDAVEEFLDNARPRFSDMVNDTKELLQQSRERMTITRVADDMTAYDSSKYTMTLPSSSASGEQRYMVGQPITVSWTAPANHSRKDWIGLYRLSAPQNVTRISSMGKWMPLYQGEYDGETPINNGDTIVKEDAGQIIFRGNQLPWTGGMYELRYHHDGKHNVMTRLAPIEIYVSKPENLDSPREVQAALLSIVVLSLDLDPKLVPRAGIRLIPELDRCVKNDFETESHNDADKDPDDFVIMDEGQAKRIACLSEQTFGVDLSTDVVIADANVATLARRILGARSLSIGRMSHGGGS